MEKHYLYHSKQQDCWGLIYYVSVFNLQLSSLGGSTLHKTCLKIRHFKDYGKHIDYFRQITEFVRDYFSCDDIVAIPSSGCEPNELQKLFGEKMQRIEAVQKAKYNETGKRNGFNVDGFRPETIALHSEQIQGRRVLVVDDIMKTGVTMQGACDMLIAEGFEVVKFVLGLSYRLIHNSKAEQKAATQSNYENFEQYATHEIEIPIIESLVPTSVGHHTSSGQSYEFRFAKMPEWFNFSKPTLN